MKDFEEDFKLAKIVRNKARCESSKFSVGAVLKCKNGNKYSGCNIENDGIQSICAERVAFVKAISEGDCEFESIFVIGGKEGVDNLEMCLPCGYCRQFISQFVDKDFKVYTCDGKKVQEYAIEELLPHAFHL